VSNSFYKQFSPFQNFLTKYALGISLSLYFMVFILVRIPYFTYLPLPFIYPDTYDYFSIVEELMNADFKGFGLLPPGFIILAYLNELFYSKVFGIIIIQHTVSFFAGLFLILVFWKCFRLYSILFAITITVFLSNSFSLIDDCSLLTESLYRSSILIVTGFFILTIKSNKTIYLLLFSISLIFPSIMRSNGIYIYFLLLIVFSWLIYNKIILPKKYLALLLPIFFLNLLWSIINFHYEGSFFPGSLNRILLVSKNITDKSTLHKQTSEVKTLTQRNLIEFKKYSLTITYSKSSFYHLFLKENHEKFFVSMHDPSMKKNDWKNTISIDLRKLVYKEYYTEEKNKFGNFLQNYPIFDYKNMWQYPLIIFYHFFTWLSSVFFNNYVWVLLYFLCIAYLVIRPFVFSFEYEGFIILLGILMMHLLSIAVITIAHGRFVPRYAIVSEVFIYFTVFFTAIDLSKIINKNHNA